jgi:hypothetical protein
VDAGPKVFAVAGSLEQVGGAHLVLRAGTPSGQEKASEVIATGGVIPITGLLVELGRPSVGRHEPTRTTFVEAPKVRT